MSDNVTVVPDIKCNRCGGTFKIFHGGNFVTIECPKCNTITRYTDKDFNKLLEIKHENEVREKEREKHYER